MKAGVGRLAALEQCIETVRRGGMLSISGVYGGTADPIIMLQLFDKQIQVRMGQANVKAWVDDIMPLLIGDGDAPHAYEIFQKKQDGAIKILLQPPRTRREIA